ncbi:MAG TPA: tRNA pseudouridine(38-40) synthase TruA [Candidatus Binataceae bacterium]|nr:tRNA pseudouridine(38-40) synthase TruA [Candidatus Binataceae bacterium]
MRIRLVLEYDGTAYCGWQLQRPGEDSIQARLEAALAQLFGQPIRVSGAGRTDAGVHALGQVAAFDAPRQCESAEVARALNALLPADICVREVHPAAPNFDPRRHAWLRIYEYRILNQPTRSVFDYRYTWHIREPLDVTAMAAAARQFIGEHDFAAFRTQGTPVRATVRRIYLSQWSVDGSRLSYRIEGSSFLRHMVRTLVATMVQIGRHRLGLAELQALLRSGTRAQAPAAAPASGLFLIGVRYGLNPGGGYERASSRTPWGSCAD